MSNLLFSSALAQTQPDLEYRDTDVDQQTEKLTVRGFFETHYYEYDNLDFRALDESSDQSIRDSDDRGAFAFTGAQLELGYQIDPRIRFVVTGSHRGLWGDDQIGETNEFGGFIYFPALYVDLYTKPDNQGIRFRIGRQFYTLGGLGRQVRDFVMADVLDMVRVDVPVGDVATWTIIPINVFSTTSSYSDVDFVSLIGQQQAETFQFRGDVLTRRFGTTLALSEDLSAPIGGEVHAFYTDFHGRGAGGDISFNGLLGNFTDNDYVVNYGVRAHLRAGPVTPFAEFNGSAGVDRKEEVAVDVSNAGFSWGAGARLDTRGDDLGSSGLVLQARYFDSQGPSFGSDGLQTSHGYVGMKAQQVGGTLFNRFLGFHPTAYAGRNGVTDTPHEPNRRSGTRAFELFAEHIFEPGLTVGAGVWHLQDTGSTEVDFSDLDNIVPPPGYSRSEFAATRRHGRAIGTEVDVHAGWQFGSHVSAFARGAIIAPGSYYSVVIDRQAGGALGSSDLQNPWSLQAGMRVAF